MDGEPVEGIDSETELIELINSEEEVLVDLFMANEDIMIKALVDFSLDAEFVVYIEEKDTMVEASANSGVELMEKLVKPGVKLLDNELNEETELVELVVVGEIARKVFEVELEFTVVEIVAVLELTVVEVVAVLELTVVELVAVLELTVLELTVVELVVVLELTVLELTVLEFVDSNNYKW